jgi:acyl-CoA synthetase (AMP-forming)/AMP-acid ligase II
MFMHRFIFALVGITAAAAAAVAIARSSTETSIRSLSKAQPLAAKCPMIDWPYGCKWRPVAQFGDQACIGAKEQTQPVAYELFKQARTLARNV